MKRGVGTVLACLFIFICVYPMSGYGADEELIMLLKNKGILTQPEVDQLLNRIKEKEKKDGSLKAYYKEGFHVDTPDKNFTMVVGGRAHMDYLSLDKNDRGSSSFDIKRARLYAQGTLYKNTEFKAEIDFGEGNDANLTDGYINFTHLPFAKIMLGQFKEPFGLEQLTSFKYVDFVERSIIANNIAPGRDIGAMLHASLFDGILGYGVGIFNGNGRNRKRDENDDKDLAGRVYLHPFMKSGIPFLEGLQVGGAFTWGNQEGTVREIVVPGSETRMVPGEVLGFLKSDGHRMRSGAEVAWALGPFSLKGEWMRTEWDGLKVLEKYFWLFPDTRNRNDLEVSGWYVGASWLLTGEKKSLKEGLFGRVTPKHPFNPLEGGWGAFELAARVESFDVDPHGILKRFLGGGLGPADQVLTDRVRSFTLGVNWYPHNMFRVSLNYVRNEFDDDLFSDLKGDDREDLILSRFQVEF